MIQQSPRAGDGAGKGSIFYVIAGWIGTCAGIFAAVMAIPIAFAASRKPLTTYLVEQWGDGLGGVFVWVIGAIEFAGIYCGAKLFVYSLLAWGLVLLGVRGFPGARA